MRIDENVYNTNIDVQNFLESLEKELKIYTVRTNTIGSLRLVLVKGEHEDVMAARNLRGVQYIVHWSFVWYNVNNNQHRVCGVWTEPTNVKLFLTPNPFQETVIIHGEHIQVLLLSHMYLTLELILSTTILKDVPHGDTLLHESIMMATKTDTAPIALA